MGLASPDSWALLAREDQWPPIGDWLIWVMMGGRGAGKTRAGAEWLRRRINDGARRVALIAPNYNDAREVMLCGESGLLNLGREDDRPIYQSSRHRLEWPNGAEGYVFSAEDPDSLRGPQFEWAWADEFCAWRYPDETLSNLRLGLRLGASPQLVITTTPRPRPSFKRLLDTKGVVITRAKTADNMRNLSPVFIAAMQEAYGGTTLGRQELGGELIFDVPGALFSRALLEGSLTKTRPKFTKIIVAIDPPVTSGKRSDACGLIVAGLVETPRHKDRVHILHDGTIQGVSPKAWAIKAMSLWERFDADYLLAEVNQGGEMVSTILATINPDVVVKSVYASRGKYARAEPVAALYEQGRVKHQKPFPELEDELCTFGQSQSGSKSPDRADALVWAVTDLLLKPRRPPRIRTI